MLHISDQCSPRLKVHVVFLAVSAKYAAVCGAALLQWGLSEQIAGSGVAGQADSG